jgi:hypothetical protein
MDKKVADCPVCHEVVDWLIFNKHWKSTGHHLNPGPLLPPSWLKPRRLLELPQSLRTASTTAPTAPAGFGDDGEEEEVQIADEVFPFAGTSRLSVQS